MILFADYEGFAVGWCLIFWAILTVPALIMGLLGVVAGALRWRGCAAGLGSAACLLELLGGALVWIGFRAEQAKLGAGAEQFRPGHNFWAGQFWPGYHFWDISILTFVLGSLAFGLGVWRERTLAAKKNGGAEL
jgi:hypothetical protein